MVVFISPCMCIGMYRDMKKRRLATAAEMEKERAEMEEEAKGDSILEKKPEDRAARFKRKKKEVDDENIKVPRVYTNNERIFAVGLLVVSGLLGVYDILSTASVTHTGYVLLMVTRETVSPIMRSPGSVKYQVSHWQSWS